MKKIYLLIIVLNTFIAIAATKTFLLTNNNLRNNNNWDVEKLNIEMGVMGAWNFFTQTQPLNKNHLNLGSWHGFQEITTKNALTYDYLEFDTLISKNGYLIGHFNNFENTKNSVKISSKKDDSFCLTISPTGEFLNKIALDNVIIKTDSWNHVSIRIDEAVAIISINEKEYSCPLDKKSPSKVGFKNGYSDVLLDNIIISDENKIKFKEDFSNNKNLILISSILFLIINIVQILIIELFFYVSKNRKKSLFLLIVVDLSLLLSVLIIYLYLLIFFTGNYPNLKSFINNLKSEEQEWVDNELELISNEVMNNNSNIDSEKIMFVGSSQTWGAGASKKEKSFPFVFEKVLNKTITDASDSSDLGKNILGISSEQKIKIVDTGVSGTTSSELYEEYKNQWIKLKPKIVFINLSSNDFTYDVHPDAFEENILNFIKLNKENDIKTILLIEASSIELETENTFHNILRKIAQNEDINIIDINQYLAENDGRGVIWWDFIHPTDYGHQLIAKYILDNFIEIKEAIQ